MHNLEFALWICPSFVLGAGGMGAISYSSFASAPLKSTERRLFDKYIAPAPEKRTFASEADALRAVVDGSEKLALYGVLQSVTSYKAYSCMYAVPWITQYPG